MIIARFLGAARRRLLPTTARPTHEARHWLRYGGLLLGLAVGMAAHAQAPRAATPAAADTLRLTLPEAEARFVQNNLQVLAQRYNITAQQALAVQARLIDNPTITLDQNALQQAIHRQGAVGDNPDLRRNQVAIQAQQLFALAGRRKAAGRAQQQAAVVEQFNLEDLVRNLRFQLRTTFYDIHYRRQTLRVYDTEIPQLRKTVDLYQSQFEKGNIALKEVIRLKAFLFTLETERVGLITDQANSQADLHILLRDSTNAVYRPVVNSDRVRDLSLNAFPEQQLIDTALVRRADLLSRQAEVQRQQLNLRLQKAVAAPDLAVGYSYDRLGSYFDNYNSITLGVAVPIFNRNQGNISAAKAQIGQAQAEAAQQQLTVRRDVHEAYQVAQRQDDLYQHTNRDTTPFSKLIDNIEQGYTKRLISIVEYLDFYEAYKNNVLQLNTLRANRMRAFENVNLSVGRVLLKAE
ncbi:MAG TPA: TolC family protein [Hymenobacter sp.]|uniref:TolC family protein n=1 Tax=Hymenobacter sp. TaxID=1898978 RepID=UPI002D80013F|nr:TolC family protein [Hymenobacter sp.]HET9504971.1 TolC family protein [Hymenobacter sp.]